MTASSHSPCDVLRAGPLRPELLGRLERRFGIDRLRAAARSTAPCVSTNGTVSPAATSNSATVLRSSPRIGAGVCSVTRSGPAIARSAPSSSARDPRNRAAVVEAKHQLHAHPHAPAFASHQSDDVRVAAARGHEVDEEDDAISGLDAGLEDQRVAAIAARHARAARRRLQ